MMKIAIRIAQGLLVFAFLASGLMKLLAFDKMSAMMPGIDNLHGLFMFIGICEVLGAIALCLTRVMPSLTPWAAAGFATIMVLAVPFHLQRGEASHLPPVIVLLLLSVFVLWGRGFRKAA